MTRHSRGPSSLSEAIEKLEQAGSSTSEEVKETFTKEFKAVKEALHDLRPYLDDVKERVEGEAKKVKNEVEGRVRENPWMAIGLVGLIAFIIGLLLGRRDRD